eukprot:TRINITY_DN54840_c0_g1_i2.p1 TRINITY_DN54840_c0_g1~~TRINITY_DN54840_c0_g1_i2.p1  ORF type:complete len:472 (+),score=4.85 TRINITY_DN54840_c0_g1_i2:23-1438(+)
MALRQPSEADLSYISRFQICELVDDLVNKILRDKPSDVLGYMGHWVHTQQKTYSSKCNPNKPRLITFAHRPDIVCSNRPLTASHGQPALPPGSPSVPLRDPVVILPNGDVHINGTLTPDVIDTLAELYNQNSSRSLSFASPTNADLVALSKLSPTVTIPSLKLNDSTAITNLHPLTHMTTLHELQLRNCKSLHDISPLPHTLTSLNLAGVPFIDLNCLRAMKNLRELVLTECDQGSNVGSKSIADLQFLQDKIKLVKLHISMAPVKDIRPLVNAVEMEQFSLCHADVRDLSVITRMIELQKISLYGTPVQEFSVLSVLTKLVEVELSFTPFDNLGVLTNLKYLKKLATCECPIYEWRQLSELSKSLEELDISGCKFLDCSLLIGLTSLRRLYMDKCPCGELAPLQQLTTLVHLSINGVKAEDIAVVSNCPTLKELVVEQDQLSFSEIKEMRKKGKLRKQEKILVVKQTSRE